MSDPISRGSIPVGGETPRRPNQKYELLQKWFTSDLQGVPVRVLYGRDEVAGTQMTPIFAFRSVEIKQKQSGGS